MILRKTLSRLVAIAPRRERVVALTMTMLLLSTAVGGPIGTVAAASSTEECSGVDAIIYDMTTIDGVLSLQDKEDHPCSPSHQRAQAIEELKNDSAEQEKLDIYNAALEQKADNRVFFDVADNYLNDSRPIAWMHAETSIANNYKNNTSESIANTDAKEEIAQYYSTKQVNLIERWNVSVRSYEVLWETAENQSSINASTYLGPHSAPNGSIVIEFKTYNHTVTLANGSTRQSRAIHIETKWKDGSFTRFQSTNFTVTGAKVVSNNGNVNNSTSLGVEDYDGGDDDIAYLNADAAGVRFDKSATLSSDLQSETDPFVNSTWTAFQNGEIRASDVISRNNLMFRYGTDALNNSNSSLYDNTAALATMGLASPNINSTGSMTVVYDGVEYTGMVLAEEAPNGTWETGTTYNTSEIGGTVLLATTDGQRIDMKGQFTLQEMKNQDGDQINQTSATKVVYKTSNTSELLDKMERILELRQQIEATKPKAGSGGTSDDGGGSDLLAGLAAFLGVSSGVALLVLAGAAFVVYKVYTP